MNDEINVEKIMEEIRAEIKSKGLVDDSASFEEIPIKEITQGVRENRIRMMKDRFLYFAYFKVFLKMPRFFQSFVKKLAGK